jgi:hypothetical protein
MARELASREGFFRFTTTPPHSATPFRGMGSARPVEVLFIVVFHGTVFTSFNLI